MRLSRAEAFYAGGCDSTVGFLRSGAAAESLAPPFATETLAATIGSPPPSLSGSSLYQGLGLAASRGSCGTVAGAGER